MNRPQVFSPRYTTILEKLTQIRFLHFNIRVHKRKSVDVQTEDETVICSFVNVACQASHTTRDWETHQFACPYISVKMARTLFFIL